MSMLQDLVNVRDLCFILREGLWHAICLDNFIVCFPLVVGIPCLSLFCCALICVPSSFAIIFTGKGEGGDVCFAFVVLRISRYSKCYVPFVGWSAVCDCGIS